MTVGRACLLGLALTAAAWTSSGLEPLRATVAGALTPADFVRTFIAARALARGDRRYAVDAERRNREAAQLGAPIMPVHAGPYLPQPPPAALLVTPLVPFGLPAASLIWLGISVLCAAWLAWSVAQIIGVTSVARTAGLFVLLLVWPPVLHNLEKGQWSILLAALMAAGWRDLSAPRQRPHRAGVWFGLAASLKVVPALMLPLLAMRHRPAARALLITAACAGVATLPAVGLTGWSLFVAGSAPNVRALESWLANTASLHGLFARLFVGHPFARPLFSAPALGHALSAGAAVILLAIAGITTTRARRDDGADESLFALWASLAVLLNPLAWTHSLILLVVPLTLLAKSAAQAGRVGLLAGLGVALALISIPKETLYRAAGDLPVSPGGTLWLSLHAAGALMIFASAARAARKAGPATKSAPGLA